MKRRILSALLAIAGVAVLTFAPMVFAQEDSSAAGSIEYTDTEVQVCYAFEPTVLEDASKIDAELVKQTKECRIGQRNAWPQSYPVDSQQEAQQLLGLTFFGSEKLEELEQNPNNKDSIRVQASSAGTITRTQYTPYRIQDGYSIVLEADTGWDHNPYGCKEYSFSFPKNKYTAEETATVTLDGKEIPVYSILDREGMTVTQCAMFQDGATNYTLYVTSFDRSDKAKQAGGIPTDFLPELLQTLQKTA